MLSLSLSAELSIQVSPVHSRRYYYLVVPANLIICCTTFLYSQGLSVASFEVIVRVPGFIVTNATAPPRYCIFRVRYRERN